MLYGRIKAMCESKGMTIAELERLAGIANGTIDGWTKGTPSIKTVKRVAEVLGESIDALVAGIDFPMMAEQED